MRSADAPAGGIGDRMGCLDDLDPLAGHGVAVAGDHEAFERPAPVLLDRLRHGGGGFAGAEDDRASFRWCRQMSRHDPSR